MDGTDSTVNGLDSNPSLWYAERMVYEAFLRFSSMTFNAGSGSTHSSSQTLSTHPDTPEKPIGTEEGAMVSGPPSSERIPHERWQYSGTIGTFRSAP